MATVLKTAAIYYPESDGRPMAETDLHRDEMFREIDLLMRHYQGQDVYVTGNLMVYYIEGDPKKSISPDVMVVKGIPQRQRRVYKIWEEGTPHVAIEVTSKKTKKQDQATKPELYARLGIRELFLFDPTEDYLHPPLRGFRLVDGEYQQLEQDSTGAIFSEELGLSLRIEDEKLMFYLLEERLLSSAEANEIAERKRLAAEQNWRSERKARLEAEAEIERLRALLREQSG